MDLVSGLDARDGVASGGGTFIAYGSCSNGSGFDYACFVSTDGGGEVWEACPALISHANSFVYDGTQWVAAIDDGYATSTDGQEWVEHPQPGFPTGLIFDGELWFGRRERRCRARNQPERVPAGGNFRARRLPRLDQRKGHDAGRDRRPCVRRNSQ